ncbi:MFS transporter [Rhodophyticola sp. MJ-SS7]|nr:MFS transporter [Rhodophyticola sp. MJ-SS7]
MRFMNLAALKSRDFRIYLIGNVFALNALWMQRLTVGWLAWDMTTSASFVGLVAFVNFSPTMFAGPFFGVLVDRVRTRHAAMVTQSALCFWALVLFASHSLGLLGPFVLVVISGLLGIAMAAHHPIRMSLAPRLVEEDDVASVVSLAAINFNLARLTGPALGGWVIATGGVGVSLVTQAAFYLPFIFALTLLRPRRRNRSSAAASPFLKDLAIGIKHVMQSALIRRAILVTGVAAFVSRGVLEILPVIADGVFVRGATGLGMLTAVAGLGALAAGLATTVMPRHTKRRLPRAALLSALAGLGLVPLIGYSEVWPLTLTLVACLGFAATMTGILMQTTIQIELADELRGRVMSLWILVSIGSTATGAMILGGLADLVGLSAGLGLSGGLGFMILAVFVRRVW